MSNEEYIKRIDFLNSIYMRFVDLAAKEKLLVQQTAGDEQAMHRQLYAGYALRRDAAKVQLTNFMETNG